MPLGLNSFSFDLFGISRQPHGRGVQEPVAARPVAPSEPVREDERSDRDRRETEELSFWGLGFFPVM